MNPNFDNDEFWHSNLTLNITLIFLTELDENMIMVQKFYG